MIWIISFLCLWLTLIDFWFERQTFSPLVFFLVRNKQIFLPPPLADVDSVRVADSVDSKWHWGAAVLFSLRSINIAALGTYLFWPEEEGDTRVALYWVCAVSSLERRLRLTALDKWCSSSRHLLHHPVCLFPVGIELQQAPTYRLELFWAPSLPPPPSHPTPPPLRSCGVNAAVWSAQVVRGWVKRSESDDFIDLPVHGFGSHPLLPDNWLRCQCIWLMAPMCFLRTSSLSAWVLHWSNFQHLIRGLTNRYLNRIQPISIATLVFFLFFSCFNRCTYNEKWP